MIRVNRVASVQILQFSVTGAAMIADRKLRPFEPDTALVRIEDGQVVTAELSGPLFAAEGRGRVWYDADQARTALTHPRQNPTLTQVVLEARAEASR